MDRELSQSDPETGSRGATSAGESPPQQISPTSMANRNTTNTLSRPIPARFAQLAEIGAVSPPGGAAASGASPLLMSASEQPPWQAAGHGLMPKLAPTQHGRSPSDRSALDVVLSAPPPAGGGLAPLGSVDSARSGSYKSSSVAASRAGSPSWGPPLALGYSSAEAGGTGGAAHHSTHRPLAAAGGAGGGSPTPSVWLSPTTSASTSSLPPLPRSVATVQGGGHSHGGGGALPSPAQAASQRTLEPLTLLQTPALRAGAHSAQGLHAALRGPLDTGGDPLPQPVARNTIPRINHSEHSTGQNSTRHTALHMGSRAQRVPFARPAVLSDEPGAVLASSLGAFGFEGGGAAASLEGGNSPPSKGPPMLESLPQVGHGPSSKGGAGGGHVPADVNGQEPLAGAAGSVGNARSITPLQGRRRSGGRAYTDSSPPSAPLRARRGREREESFAGAAGIQSSDDEDDPA